MCGSPIRLTGPAGGLASQIFFDISAIFLFSAVRVMEIAFTANEPFPSSMKILLPKASQLNTSGVIVSLKRARTNLTASKVCFELMTTFPSSS